MSAYAIPAVTTSVVVTLPQPYGDVASPRPYRVMEVRDRQVTLQSQVRSPEPFPAPGTPCLIGSLIAGRPSRSEAVVVAAGASMLIVDVARDPRQHPRYRRPCKVTLELPDTDLGVIEGISEDISAGGMRVHAPVVLPVDHRVFVSIMLADTQAILAIAEVRGVHRGAAADDLVARLQFTLMAPTHAARLATLLEWPMDDLGSDQRSDVRRREVLSTAR